VLSEVPEVREEGLLVSLTLDPSSLAKWAIVSLPELPVPEKFKPLFRDWAAGKVNFTAPAHEPA
jgi:hypothetical protein